MGLLLGPTSACLGCGFSRSPGTDKLLLGVRSALSYPELTPHPATEAQHSRRRLQRQRFGMQSAEGTQALALSGWIQSLPFCLFAE